MKYKIIFVALLSLPMWAQEKTWSLTDCINYAVTNNISVKKTELSQQTASINLHQAKSNRLPSVATNASANVNNGSVINQITNDRVNQTTFTNSFGVSASLPLYEGGSSDCRQNVPNWYWNKVSCIGRKLRTTSP